jgi:hypothetical protein
MIDVIEYLKKTSRAVPQSINVCIDLTSYNFFYRVNEK